MRISMSDALINASQTKRASEKSTTSRRAARSSEAAITICERAHISSPAQKNGRLTSVFLVQEKGLEPS